MQNEGEHDLNFDCLSTYNLLFMEQNGNVSLLLKVNYSNFHLRSLLTKIMHCCFIYLFKVDEWNAISI